MSSDLTSTLIAGIFGLLTMVGGPLVAYLLGRGSKRFEEASKLRDELWKELHATRELNRELSKQNTELGQQLLLEKTARTTLENELRDQIADLRRGLSTIKRQNRALRSLLEKNGITLPVDFIPSDALEDSVNDT